MSRLPLRVLLLALAAVALPAMVFSAWGSATEDAPVSATGSEAAVATTTTSGVPLLRPRDGLVVAGQPATGDWSALAASGIRTVINLRPQAELQGRDERAEVAAAGMRYVELPVSGPAEITPENAEALSRLLAQADGPVLVHCASGNRVGGLLAVAMAQSGMPVSAALDFGRSAGMKSIEGRTREVIEQTQALRCVAARENGDPSQCPAGG
ncbi:MAG: protein tyrosine phosphatase family protein [Pseudomonadota bacterium]